MSSRTTLVPPYSGRRTFSPTFTLTGCTSPFCKIPHNNYTTTCSPHTGEKKSFSRGIQRVSHLVDRAWSSCHHSGLQHLPLRLFWQHDAPLCNRLCSEALYQHTVKQRQEFSKGLEIKRRSFRKHQLLLRGFFLGSGFGFCFSFFFFFLEKAWSLIQDASLDFDSSTR